MEYYFDTDDKLGRRKYAEFLKSMLENCDKYRREDSDGAYVIAIDSPWGMGKTRFAKMLRNYLEDRTKEMGADSRPGRNASFNAIYYNSWETDFCDDALLPIIHAIAKSPEFKADRFDKQCKNMLEKFKESATAVVKVVLYSALHNLAGDKVVEVIKSADEALSQQIVDPLERYQERLNLLDKFRKSLEIVIKHTMQKKLVIIIDELDRCRPTFAIQTLELAKHLFAVKGLIFIFALDIQQLSSSVKTVYGQEMDASGYLCRFFDYIGKMPLPYRNGHIGFLLDKYDLSKAIESTRRLYSFEEPILYEFVKFTADIIRRCNLSYRDISTLFSTFKIMHASFIHRYIYLETYKLYFLLLVVKYRNSNLYSEMVLEAGTGNLNSKLANFFDPEDSILRIQLEYLGSSKKISENELFIYTHDSEGQKEVSMYSLEEIRQIIKIDEGQVILKYRAPRHLQHNLLNYFVDRKVNVSFNLILFLPDLKKWRSIQDLTPMQYYHQQLEMFNFALPADEPETDA